VVLVLVGRGLRGSAAATASPEPAGLVMTALVEKINSVAQVSDVCVEGKRVVPGGEFRLESRNVLVRRDAEFLCHRHNFPRAVGAQACCWEFDSSAYWAESVLDSSSKETFRSFYFCGDAYPLRTPGHGRLRSVVRDCTRHYDTGRRGTGGSAALAGGCRSAQDAASMSTSFRSKASLRSSQSVWSSSDFSCAHALVR